MREQPVDRYPLQWPVGWPRAASRKAAQFGYHTEGSTRGRCPLTIPVAIERLMRNVDLLGATDAVLSTDVELTLSGQPRAKSAAPADPGVALYFRHRGKPIALACDKWTRVADNINAISGHIDAIRRMDRYGVGRLEQALAGYQRLLSGRRAWFEVLGFKEPPTSRDHVERVYKQLAKDHAPRKAGDDETKMREINEAYQTAMLEFGQ